MITAFLIFAEPEKLQYPYAESLTSLARFCDRIIINLAAGKEARFRPLETVSLDRIWSIAGLFPECQFDIVMDELWPVQSHLRYKDLHRMFQTGLDRCDRGWFLRFDGDNVFHKESGQRLRAFLTGLNREAHLVVLPRIDVVNRKSIQLNSGSRDMFALNVDLLNADGIRYEISRQKEQWCRAEVSEGAREIVIRDESLMPLNYDATFFTRERLLDFWRKTHVMYENEGIRSSEAGMITDDHLIKNYKAYIMRKRSCPRPIDQHPEDIAVRVDQMTPDMWGYNNFGGLR